MTDGPTGELRVRGGPGGTAARLEDLDRAGVHLRTAGEVMVSVAVRAARVAADPAVALSAPESPATWVAVQGRLAVAVGPPAGAVVVAARLTGLGTAVRDAADLYRSADAAADVTLHAAEVAVGRVVGTVVTVPVLAALATTPQVVIGGALGLTALAAAGDLPLDRTRTVDGLLGLLGGHTGAVERAVAALPGVVGGVLDAALPGALLPGALLPGALLPGAVPPDVPGAAGWLARLAAAGPWLHEDGTVTVTARRRVPVRPPAGLADVVGAVASLDPERGAPPGTVRVVAVTRPDGRRAWVVHVPGTQNWSPRAECDPLDLTGNVHGMAGEPTAGRALVVAALRAAGVPRGEPVLLTGHSQGGLIAAQLAADPAFRASYDVTHVVTAGSPVASVRVPDTVAVLSLEHDEDLVPRLDGAVNPDRPTWVTVSRSTAPAGAAPSPAVAHELSSYTATAAAVDGSADPGLVRWRAGLAPFLAAPGATAEGVEVTGVRGRGGSPPP